MFVFKVDLSCIVSSIRWYHEMENGTEKIVKVLHYYNFQRIYIL